MSLEIGSKSVANNAVECVLSASDSYVETISIQNIDAQPGLVELVIKTQLLKYWQVLTSNCGLTG
jgi:hypothetical protein